MGEETTTHNPHREPHKWGSERHEKHGLISQRELLWLDTFTDTVSGKVFERFTCSNQRKFIVLGIGAKVAKDVDVFEAVYPQYIASRNSFNSLMFASFAFQYSPNIKMFDVSCFSQGEELIYINADFFNNYGGHQTAITKGFLRACIFEI